MDQTALGLKQLFSLLDQRGRVAARNDAEQVAALDEEVGAAVDRVARAARRPMCSSLAGPPPRPVGVAMAQALFSTPHVSRTLAVETTLSDHHGFQPSPHLADALGLPVWELEEIREDIDRRVASFLKQTRALNWLWFRFDNPSIHPRPLFHTLFPGVAEPLPERFVRRGGRLYAVLDQTSPPPMSALYLRWLPAASTWTASPDDHFSARYVDNALCRGIERGVGAEPDEARRILDNMVCAVPKGQSRAFIVHDRWRNEGWAELSGLGMADPSPGWLAWPIPPHAIETESWLTMTEDGLAMKAPRRVFDRHAMTRMTALAHGIYAEFCARVLGGHPIDPLRQAELFDLGPYIQRALQPLLDWAASPKTHAYLSQKMQVPRDHIAAALLKARDIWLQSAQASWGGAPTEGRPHTVQTLMATHLAVAQIGLHHVYKLTPDPRGPHHRVLLLFFAHYMQQAPLGRLWRVEGGALPPMEDVVGEWFWGAWQRVLRALEREDASSDV